MPNKFRTILLDLDGTVVRSEEGIFASLEYAFSQMGIPSPGRGALAAFIGPPLEVSFKKFCGFSDGDAQKAIALYRARYAQKGIYENELYGGMEGLLASLAEKGAALHLATSKPEVFAVQILEHLGVAKYFSSMHGVSLTRRGQTKGDVIAEVFTEEKAAAGEAVMVGDRHHDIDGAKEHGLFSIGVLYGYGNRAELESAGADVIVADVAALSRFLLQGEAPDGKG